jgi:hypothetical protein
LEDLKEGLELAVIALKRKNLERREYIFMVKGSASYYITLDTHMEQLIKDKGVPN